MNWNRFWRWAAPVASLIAAALFVLAWAMGHQTFDLVLVVAWSVIGVVQVATARMQDETDRLNAETDRMLDALDAKLRGIR